LPTEPTERWVSAARSQELWFKSKLQRVQQALSSRVGTLKESQADLKAAVQKALSKAARELAFKLSALDAQHRDTAHRAQAEHAAAVDNARAEAAAAAGRTAAEHEATVARLMAEHQATLERLVVDQVCIRFFGLRTLPGCMSLIESAPLRTLYSLLTDELSSGVGEFRRRRCGAWRRTRR
jgi:hypothetical protein